MKVIVVFDNLYDQLIGVAETDEQVTAFIEAHVAGGRAEMQKMWDHYGHDGKTRPGYPQYASEQAFMDAQEKVVRRNIGTIECIVGEPL